jgi:phospholipid-transporting ATPase
MTYHNAYKKEGFIFKSIPQYTEMPNRSIITNVPDLEVCDNSIKTSKYNVFNFLFLNLIVQFSKLPNIYFLVIGIMQMIPQITISGGFPVIFIPLSIVVGVSAVKDFYEDMKRKMSDNEINNQRAYVLTSEGFK